MKLKIYYIEIKNLLCNQRSQIKRVKKQKLNLQSMRKECQILVIERLFSTSIVTI